jgi:hypothetical protein
LSVHHPARGDHLGARVGERGRLELEVLERRVVVDVAFGRQHAAVAVVGVLAEADVRDAQERGRRVRDALERALDDPLGRPREPTLGILLVGDAEQDDRGNPELFGVAACLGQSIERFAEDARHRRHGLADALALDDEEREDEIVLRDVRLAHEAPQRGVRTQPSRALDEVLGRERRRLFARTRTDRLAHAVAEAGNGGVAHLDFSGSRCARTAAKASGVGCGSEIVSKKRACVSWSSASKVVRPIAIARRGSLSASRSCHARTAEGLAKKIAVLGGNGSERSSARVS